jgi:hypothetical protein
MMVLKHILYIQYGCGMKSVVVYSLNHNTTTSFGLHLTKLFQILATTCSEPYNEGSGMAKNHKI